MLLLQPCHLLCFRYTIILGWMAAWLLGEDLLLFKVLYKSVCEAHNIVIQGQVCNRIVYITAIIIYMKKTFNSDWLRAVQFKRNTSSKKCTWHQCKLHFVILDYDWLIDNRNFLTQWYHVKWWQKFCAETVKKGFLNEKKMASRKTFWHMLHTNFVMFILLISNHESEDWSSQ